ncbi:Uncharacterised protein [Candidatus Tiddalikarchaeum anstoanum]|nr:Uncharacterised protein [Candidatus Tiddalikarchaeum anstoanum]
MAKNTQKVDIIIPKKNWDEFYNEVTRLKNACITYIPETNTQRLTKYVFAYLTQIAPDNTNILTQFDNYLYNEVYYICLEELMPTMQVLKNESEHTDYWLKRKTAMLGHVAWPETKIILELEGEILEDKIRQKDDAITHNVRISKKKFYN